jgi:hypothetical protein
VDGAAGAAVWAAAEEENDKTAQNDSAAQIAAILGTPAAPTILMP